MGIPININEIIRGEKDVEEMSIRCQQDEKTSDSPLATVNITIVLDI